MKSIIRSKTENSFFLWIKKKIQKGYNADFMESPLLFQELNEAGYLAMELHDHSFKPNKEKNNSSVSNMGVLLMA